MFDLRQTLDLIEEGAFDEAANALQQAVAQMPAYTPAYVLLAQTYEAQARWPEALAAWQRARFFAPNSPTVQAGLIRALDHQDVMPDAVAETEAPDVDVPDPMDQAAQLLDTIRNDTAPPPSEPGEHGAPPRDEAEPPSAVGTPADAPESAASTETDTQADTEAGEDADADDTPPTQRPAQESTETDAVPDEEEADREPPEASPDAAKPAAPAAEPRPSPLDELARRLPDTDQPLPDDLQDLDRLIDELEDARIDPQPDVSDAPEPDLDSDIDDMVSETLARIYISQEQYEEAARVYLRLASQEPDRAKEHMEQAAALRERARDADAGD
jgi:tetratricopeptide (TPR) repeat protein